MCCNDSKNTVASTWSSCVELSVQYLFLEICANAGLTIYRGDATDAYGHYPAPNNTYLQVDNAYTE